MKLRAQGVAWSGLEGCSRYAEPFGKSLGTTSMLVSERLEVSMD